MREAKKDALQAGFDRKLKLEFHALKITSDVCFLLYRELDEALGLLPLARRRQRQKFIDPFKPWMENGSHWQGRG